MDGATDGGSRARAAAGRHGWRRGRVAAALALVLLCLLPGTAAAHAHLIQADPAADAVLALSPSLGRFWFDEDLNAALSRVVILDSANQPVTNDTGHLAPGSSREVVVALPRLPNGRYTVQWTSASAQDGHILHGFYSFSIGTGAAAPTPGAPASGVSEPPLDATALGQIAARWVTLLALTLWTGLLALTLTVLAPAGRYPAQSPVGQLARGALPRATVLATASLLVLLLATWSELAVQGLSATNGDVGQALSLSTLHSLVLGTQYGTLWLLRVGLITIALLISLLPEEPLTRDTRDTRDTKEGAAGVPRRKAPRAQAVMGPLPAPLGALGPTARAQVAAILAGTFLLALSLSGHAATVPDRVALSVLIDWLHLLATTGWLGGIMALVVLILPALRRLPAHTREEALIFSVDRFSPVAAVSVALLAATGLYNALQRIAAPDELLTTEYGHALVTKLGLVGAMVLVSASHVFGVRPRLRRLRAAHAGRATAEVEAEAGQLVGVLIARLQIEPFLGAGVLLCVAVMVATLPSRPLAPAGARNTTAGPIGVQATAPAAGSSLRVMLVVTPAALGRNDMTATLLRPAGLGTWRPEDDGQVRIKVMMPIMPTMGAGTAETTMIGGGRYRGRADIVMGGDWRLDVLVRTPADPLTYHDAPFRLSAGLYGQPPVLQPWDRTPIGGGRPPTPAPTASARGGASAPAALALAAGPWRGTAAVTPDAYGPNRFVVRLADRAGHPPADRAITLVLTNQEMDMGTIRLQARRTGAGVYAATGTLTMGGRWRLEVQTARGSGATTLTAATAGSTMTAGRLRTAGGYATPVYHTRLPYAAFVSELDGNAVTLLNRGTAHHAGPSPHGIDFVARRPWLYATDIGGATVTVLDIHSGRPVATIAVGLGPAHVIFGDGARRAYVTNLNSADVSVIDVAHQKAIARVPVGLNPHGIDITPDGRYVYVACILGGGVYKIDTRTNTVAAAIPTGLRPYGVAVDPAGRVVFVSDAMLNEVEVLDLARDTVIARIPVGKAPALMVAAPDGRLYVANHDSNSVTVIDMAHRRVVATVPVGGGPHGLDATPDGTYVYVANNNTNSVSIIRTRDERVIATLHVGGRPNEVAIQQQDDLAP